MQGTGGRRKAAAVAAAAIVLATPGCASDERSAAPEPSASVTHEEQALSKGDYLERVDELCSDQAEVVEAAHSADTPEEFVQTLESHFDETVTFIEGLKELDSPASYEKDHAAFVTHEEELQELDELLNQLPRSEVGSLLAALARRSEIAEELHYVVQFSELPDSCRFESGNRVLTVGFFTEANLSCFNFANDLAVLFQQEANRPPQASFGADFIGRVRDRAEQLITELDTAVPDLGGFKKTFNMITLYSTAVESLDDLEKALAQRDVGAGTAAINDYQEATAEGDRLASDLRIGCAGAMRIDWQHVDRERIN